MKLIFTLFLWIVYSVEAQERLFFGNRAFITVSRSTIISTTTTVIPTCYEVDEQLNTCSRKKRQYGFLVDPFEYYHGIIPRPVNFIQPSAISEFRYSPLLHQAIYNVQPFSEEKTPSLQTSINEKAEAEGRFFLPKLLTVQTSTSVVTVPTVASVTQTYSIQCTVSGQSIPENLCEPQITFPPVPEGFTLQQYCQSISDAAQMAITECKLASKRKRSRDNRPVVMRFGRKPGGRFPTRKVISNNILAFCGFKQSCSFPGFTLNLLQIVVPGFPNIIAAGGQSSSFTTG
ncbi:uncharacterized protein LOC136028217 [Artemia franciscana]|uniref:Uncharacterized protein n=1 Tax=Artemia franciscana TaxID=6661 RepID=A0AA88L5J0_ARTSF|nr:hypothetical protein QYM36_014364 [Artemia franciscana]KAK2708736.1 hypothetical protein QYM36_014364 [Artemia franciscana]